jgi:hypothetical protein
MTWPSGATSAPPTEGSGDLSGRPRASGRDPDAPTPGTDGDGSLGSPSLSCWRRRFSKASRARLRSRAWAFSASFFFFLSSAVTRRAARSAVSSGTRGREGLCHPTS